MTSFPRKLKALLINYQRYIWKKKTTKTCFYLNSDPLEGVSAVMRGLQKIRNEAQSPLQIVSPERQSNVSNYR